MTALVTLLSATVLGPSEISALNGSYLMEIQLQFSFPVEYNINFIIMLLA